VTTDTLNNKNQGQRIETRFSAKSSASVEFKPEKLEISYHFKLRDISKKGLCILVKEDSAVLNSIHVGDTISMKYYPDEIAAMPVEMLTEISHISKPGDGKFKNHMIVGLYIIDS